MGNDSSQEQSKLEERLKAALRRLDVTSQFIVQSIYGILGCPSRTTQKVAQCEKVSQETISGLQADALRALMGYGPKAHKEDSNLRSTKTNTKSSVENSDLDIGDLVN